MVIPQFRNTMAFLTNIFPISGNSCIFVDEVVTVQLKRTTYAIL